MWLLLLINSYVIFTFQCRDSGVGIVSTLRDERLGFPLRQGLMCVYPRQNSERIWWPRALIIGHPVFVHRLGGVLAWFWALIHIQLRDQESMELCPHSLIHFHDALLGWASEVTFPVFHWLQTTAVRYTYVCSSQFSLWTDDSFYSSADIRHVLKTVV
jgi:hypothetical protein